MATIAMIVDLDRCVGCFACQAACKVINSLPEEVNWLKVMPKEQKPDEVDGKLVMDRFPVPVSLRSAPFARPSEWKPAFVRHSLHG